MTNVRAGLALELTLLGYALAESIDDDEKLGLLAAAFTQLGDVLATILTQRALCSEVAEE